MSGGIHSTLLEESNGGLIIDFLDFNGCNITRKLERNIENIFIREDFSRCEASDVKRLFEVNNFTSFYLRNILNKAKSKNMNKKILINADSEFVYSVFKDVLEELGCKVENVSIKPVKSKNKEYSKSSNDLIYFVNYVRLSNADLGVSIDNNCEKILLVDDIGRIINDDLYLAVSTLILFKKYRGSSAFIPISASNVMEKLAKKYKGKIIRTKTSIQEIMSNLNTVNSKRVMEEQFAFNFDALESLVKILDFMTLNKLKLSQLVNMVPDFYMSRKIVECPWEAKGKVMRTLAEEKDGDKKELYEGVKVYKDGGWVLVLPDAEKPVCKVIGEGASEEFAEELTDIYVEKIKEIRQE